MVRRWKKMSQDKGRGEITNLFIIWSAIFLAISVIPAIPDLWKYALYLLDTLVFSFIAITDWQRKAQFRPNLKILFRFQPNLRAGWFFWFRIVADLILVVAYFNLAIANWVVLNVSGVPVLTYGNIVCLMFGVVGVFLIRDIVGQTRKRLRGSVNLASDGSSC